MGDDRSIINFGDATKPVTVLLEKLSEACGGYFKPFQIKRVAHAEAEADKIRAASQIEITELKERALRRFVSEEEKKQQNIEAIGAKAIPGVTDDARPEDMDDDWITNFFDKCRLISNDDMQTLWSKVLAGEANVPGSYCKRTVDSLGSLDRTDAELFRTVCGFSWIAGAIYPLIYDTEAQIYREQGITFSSFKHLDDIGLISFEAMSGYLRQSIPKTLRVSYFGIPIDIEFQKDSDNQLNFGNVLLTQVGRELAPICSAQPVPGFLDYVVDHWCRQGLILSSPWPATGLR